MAQQTEEIFRNELMQSMIGVIDGEQMQKLGNAIATLFMRFKVEEKCTEVGFVDNTSENLRKRFIASLRLEGKSETTLRQYEMVIRMFFDDIQKNVDDITTNDIRYHLAIYQSTRKVSNATIDNRRRILSSFFSWLTKEEYIDKNPILRISKIKSEKEVKIPFSHVDVEKMKVCASLTRNGKRDRALIEFLMSTGCRVSEVVGLNLDNVDFRRGECIVHGKGNKDRKVYLTDVCLEYLNEYLSSRKKNSEVLFTNRNGERWSKQSIEKIIKTIAHMAEVKNAHPHRFRRTFATNALNRGMPVQHLQKILGHKSLDTTMIYCQVDDDLIKFEHKKVA